MFTKLRLSEINKSHIQEPSSYTARSTTRKKIKDESYSKIHRNRKNMISHNINHKIVRSPTYLFQGQWLGMEKNGEGIMMMKDGTMIIGNWHKDYLTGIALIFPPLGGFVRAEFINGRLNGWMVSQFSDRLITYVRFFQDKIDGMKINFEANQELWVASKFSPDGKFLGIVHAEKGNIQKLPSFVDFDDLETLHERFIIDKRYIQGFQKIIHIQMTKKLSYIGFSEQGQPQGLGTTFSGREKFIGNFSEGSLNVYGRMQFPNGHIYQGSVTDGELHGEGIYYDPEKNTTVILHTFEEGSSEVVQSHEGYINIDMPFTIGIDVLNNFIGTIGNSLEQINELVENSYCQYFIERRIKEEKQYSIKSVDNSSGKFPVRQVFSRQEEERESEKKSYEKGQWISENGGESQIESDHFVLRESQPLTKNKNQRPKEKSPPVEKVKSTKKPITIIPSDEFISIQVKENHNHEENQKFKLHTPKAGSKQKLLSEYSKSMEVNQMTFRQTTQAPSRLQTFNEDQKKKDENENEKKKYCESHVGSNNPQNQNNSGLLEVKLMRGEKFDTSQESESQFSQISEKLKVMMRKSSTMRRKIFE